MFKIGDKVKFKKSSLATGMIDATEEDVFTILYVEKCHVMLKELGSWWSVNHFEHLKEEIMQEPVVENQPINWEGSQIDWQVGQEVWDLILGKGVVFAVHNELTRTFACQPIVIKFDSGELFDYSMKGVSNIPALKSLAHKRTLFFSEPIVTAELFPPKKPFVPTLKRGDRVHIYTKGGLFPEGVVREVFSEVDDRIYISEDGHYFMKHDIESIHILGEEIKFS